MPGQQVNSEEDDSEFEEDDAESRAGIVFDVLSKQDLTTSDIDNAIQVLDFVQYLLDDDSNLTKSMALNKGARDQLAERIIEVFEGRELEEEDLL